MGASPASALAPRGIERPENSPADCFQQDGAGRPAGGGFPEKCLRFSRRQAQGLVGFAKGETAVGPNQRFEPRHRQSRMRSPHIPSPHPPTQPRNTCLNSLFWRLTSRTGSTLKHLPCATRPAPLLPHGEQRKTTTSPTIPRALAHCAALRCFSLDPKVRSGKPPPIGDQRVSNCEFGDGQKRTPPEEKGRLPHLPWRRGRRRYTPPPATVPS